MKKKSLFFLKIITYIIVIYLLINKINYEDVLKITSDLNLLIFLFAIILFSFMFLIQSYYHYKLTNLIYKLDIDFKQWIQIFFKSTLFNTILPFTGTAYRAIILKKIGLSYKNFFLILSTIAIMYLGFFSYIFLNLVLFFKYGFLYPILLIILSLILFFTLYKKFYAILKYFNLKFFIALDIIFYKKALTFFILQFIFDFLVLLICIYSLSLYFSFEKIYYIFSTNYFVDRIGFYNYPGFGEYFMGIFFQILGFTFTSGAILKLIIRISQWLSIFLTFFFLSIFFFINKSNDS